MVTVQAGYLQTCQWEPPPLWRFRGGAASVGRREPFSSPATETGAELCTDKQNYQKLFTPELLLCLNVKHSHQYILQWGFWRGRHQRSHSRADPLWFFQDPGCWHVGQPPAKQKCFTRLIILSSAICWFYLCENSFLTVTTCKRTFAMRILSLWQLFYHYSWILLDLGLPGHVMDVFERKLCKRLMQNPYSPTLNTFLFIF